MLTLYNNPWLFGFVSNLITQLQSLSAHLVLLELNTGLVISLYVEVTYLFSYWLYLLVFNFIGVIFIESVIYWKLSAQCGDNFWVSFYIIHVYVLTIWYWISFSLQWRKDLQEKLRLDEEERAKELASQESQATVRTGRQSS